jgi:UDP-N-acetylmuramate--alanine ligase
MIAVITNIDADHMDTYGHDPARLKQAFVEFTRRLPFYGAAVLCVDDANVREILPFISRTTIAYGLSEGAAFRAVDVRAEGTRMSFKVLREESPALPIVLNLPGVHNVRNALAAIAVADELGVADEAIVAALADFKGVGRRFQRHGAFAVPRPAGGSFLLVDDYGHHPAEMEATIAAARGAYPGRRLVLAFQPHRYTRTRDLFEDFVRVLGTVDELLLAEVYPAGEPAIVAADSRSLARAVRVAGRIEPRFVERIGQMPQAILDTVRDGDLVLTMGAGSVGTIPAAIRELALAVAGPDEQPISLATQRVA